MARRRRQRKETTQAESFNFDPPPELEVGADDVAERFPVKPLPPPVGADLGKRHCGMCGSRAKYSRYGVNPDGSAYYHRCSECGNEWKEPRR